MGIQYNEYEKNLKSAYERKKIDKYDALKIAIEIELSNYRRMCAEAERHGDGMDVISVYNKGRADICKGVIEMLERWSK